MVRRRWRWIGLGLLGAGLAIALRVRPNSEDVYEQALGALEAGRFDAAEAGMARLGRIRTPTVLDWGVRARLAIARGRTDDALAALSHIPGSHPLASWAHLRVGQLELRRHRFRVAEAALRNALDRKPDLIEARRELIYILGLQLRRRELDEQFEALAAATTLKAREVWIWCMVPDLVWWAASEHSPILLQALEADADDRWSRLALAENNRRLGKYSDAEAVLAPLPASDPDARAARAGLALDRQGPEAAAALLADGPDDHAGLAGLRGRLALSRRDGAAAVRHFQLALAAEPDRRGTLSDLGRAWVLAGHPEKGKPYIAAAARIDALDNLLLYAELRTDKADPALWHQLGAACEAARRLPEAHAWYALAIAHNPLDDDAQRALFRLGSKPAGPSAPGSPERRAK